MDLRQSLIALALAASVLPAAPSEAVSSTRAWPGRDTLNEQLMRLPKLVVVSSIPILSCVMPQALR